MINEATKAKKLGHDLKAIENPKTGLPLKADRGDPRASNPHNEKVKGYQSIFSKLDPRLQPIFKEIDRGIANEIKYTIFLSFTSLPKLGLNPRSRYNTPNGIYNYQMNRVNYNDLLNNNLPYVATAAYIQFFKIKPQYIDNIAVITRTTGKLPTASPSLATCYLKFIKKYPEVTKTRFLSSMFGAKASIYRNMSPQELAQKAEEGDSVLLEVLDEKLESSTTSHWGKSSDIRKLWTLGFSLNDINKWSHLFINDFKIYGAIDEGTSTIHPNEPNQSVFFSNAFIEHLSQIDNPYLGPKKSSSQGANISTAGYSSVKKKDGFTYEYYNGELTQKIKYNDASQYHNDSGPALIEYYPNGQISQQSFYKENKLHNTAGPAVIGYHEDGSKKLEYWFVDGIHTDGLCVVEYYGDGSFYCQEWRLGGKRHREGGPARIVYYPGGATSIEYWAINGAPHRADGPASIYYNSDGSIDVAEYFYKGHRFNDKKEYEDYLKKNNIVKESKISSKIRIVLR